MPSEIWRPVRTAPNYEVSNLGAVRRIGGKLRKLSLHRTGYLTVQLRHSGCVVVTCLVHRLVADAFIGTSSQLVDHRNTNTQDNRVDNLRYATASQNNSGRKPRGKTTSVRPVPKQDAVWRTVPDWPEYQVSSCGCVRRESVVPGSQGLPLRPWIGGGYLQVALCQSGKKTSVYVHAIVAAAFHGPRPKGYVIDHGDRDKLNNAEDNLEYVTPSQNAKRFERTLGVTRRGRAHAKLNEESVAKIKERIRNGEQLKSIRRDYPVAPHTLSNIKTGRTWGYVQ